MITAAGIEDQELAIAAKRTGVNHPTVAGRGDLRARKSGDRLSSLGSIGPIGSAEVADFCTIDRQVQMAAHGGKRHRGREPPWILKRGKIRPGGILLDRTGLGMRHAGGWIEVRFELADQFL